MTDEKQAAMRALRAAFVEAGASPGDADIMARFKAIWQDALNAAETVATLDEAMMDALRDERDEMRAENAALRQAFGEAWQEVERRRRKVRRWDGKEWWVHEEEALAVLLDAQAVFANGRKYICEGGEQPETVVLFVNCNDVFAWGCADAEDLPYGEIAAVYEAWEHPSGWGVERWCCIRRNEKPQRPVEERIRGDGAWDAVMEALPENRYDAACRAEYEKRKAAEGAT